MFDFVVIIDQLFNAIFNNGFPYNNKNTASWFCVHKHTVFFYALLYFTDLFLGLMIFDVVILYSLLYTSIDDNNIKIPSGYFKMMSLPKLGNILNRYITF